MDLVPFDFRGNAVRVIEEDGEIFFVAKDVCDVLGYHDRESALRKLDNDEKGTEILRTLGGNQSMSVINESGLYKLILRSNKEEAKPFCNWVTKEVLPSIRKTGGIFAQRKCKRDSKTGIYQEHRRSLRQNRRKEILFASTGDRV